jgi:hypothetical protein
MLTRSQIAVCRRVVDAARRSARAPSDKDLTEVELIVDDLEAAVAAYELWIADQASARTVEADRIAH